ncbi:MAG TPA: hypothetical protein VJ694_00295 [Patescibacteria group bacterium]|nr:hypothetical protein [Patescibacteria group bacterium]
MSLRSWIRGRIAKMRAWIQGIRARRAQERQVAVHEAGHALAAWLLPSFNGVTEVTILPVGDFRGYTLTSHALSDPPTRREIVELMTMAMAGSAAERLLIGTSDGGSLDDMIHAVAYWLMYRHDLSPESALGVAASLMMDLLAGDPRRRLNAGLHAIPPLAYSAEQAVLLLRPRLADVRKLAAALRRRKTLHHADLERLLGPRPT